MNNNDDTWFEEHRKLEAEAQEKARWWFLTDISANVRTRQLIVCALVFLIVLVFLFANLKNIGTFFDQNALWLAIAGLIILLSGGSALRLTLRNQAAKKIAKAEQAKNAP